MFGYLIVVFAFLLGFVLVRASTCTVAATKRWVNRGKPDWFVGIMVAVGWSGATLLVIQLAFPDQFTGPLNAPIDLMLILASIMMGLGAYLNNGCFIGTVGRISSGETSYLFTFAGLIAARAIGDHSVFDPFLSRHEELQDLMVPAIAQWSLLAVFLSLAVYGLYLALWDKQTAIRALCLMGIFAALTFASDPDWSYEAWVGNIVQGRGLSAGLLLELSVLGLFSGAFLSSILKEKFELRGPGLLKIVLCFCGGALMGLGAKFVPGGNDTLLLWVIPNLALHGAVAFAIMMATVATLEYSMRLFRRA